MRLSCIVQLRWHATVYLRQNIINCRQHHCSGAAAAIYHYNNNHPSKISQSTTSHSISFIPLHKASSNQTLFYCTQSGRKDDLKSEGEGEKKLSLLQRFKQMYRDYWYVLVPVHVVTSIVWFGGFYYIAKSGVDVAAILTNLGFSEKITSPLKDSSAGYLAVSYAMYKIATPARYTVTLGGTTISINYLKQWGYIKPIPPKEKLKEMYAEKKESVVESYREKRESMVESYREKKESMVESYREKKESVRTGLQEAKAIAQGLRHGLGTKGETAEKGLPGSKNKDDVGTKT
ncbi:uncharacterized protein C18orf19 homolog A [Ischnura elegans]|uniref:uncharacterized protein C18orf19 homolog A n=1 Tax=Ischnura elegans TaxID=197161 RepID=UPI001ED88408|nr:uncharacterized protein C18orf19 homolog A [Ischnura elegans]